MNRMSKPSSASTKVPLWKKLAWGSGGAADNIMYNGVSSLVLPIFNIGLGLDAVKLGFAIGLPRLLDAISDPVIGHISDNARTRWGRRRPFIFCAALVVGLLIGILFSPNPQWSKDALFWWFLIWGALFYLAYAVFVIPYSALGLEITTDYNERTRLLAWRPYLGFASGLAIPWLYKLCFFYGKNEVIGVRTVAWIMAACVMILGIIPAIFIKEVPTDPAHAGMPFLLAMKVTFKNRAFLILTASTLCILLAMFLVAPIGLYLTIYYVFEGNRAAAATVGGVSGMVGMFSGYLGLPFAAWLSAMIGKRHATIGLLVVGMVSALSTWWLYTPTQIWLQLVPSFFTGFALNGAFLIGVSMLGDVCDMDELETGLRREGIYSASMEFGKKCAIAFSTILSGYVLAVTRFDQTLAVQGPETIFRLRLCFIVVVVFCLLLSAFIISFYPITHARAMAVRSELETRIRPHDH